MIFAKKNKQKVNSLSPLEIIDKLLDIKKEVLENISYDELNKGHERFKFFRDKWIVVRIDELIEKAKQTKTNQETITRNKLAKRSKSRDWFNGYSVEEIEKENRISDGVIILIVLAMRELECIKNMVSNDTAKLDLSDEVLSQVLSFNEYGQYIALASELATGVENDLVYNTKISSEELEQNLKTNEKS